MSVPKSVIKLNKNGVQYVSSCDRAQYTIKELTRAALRDVGKFLVRQYNMKAQELPGMKRNPRVRGKTQHSSTGHEKLSVICKSELRANSGTHTNRSWEPAT